MPRPRRDYEGSALTLAEWDRIVNKIAFREWMEGTEPCTIDVIFERPPGGFYATVTDHQGRLVWKSAPKWTAQKAQSYGEGMVSLYRGLGRQKMAGMAAPDVQIAYGIGERQHH